jgi:hypothetical protein
MKDVARTTIFISYSHQDSAWLDRLRVHLKPLEREHGIEIWDDSKIGIGDNWQESVRQALERAKVAVLLISADFHASEFITTNELPSLLSASEKTGMVILPLIISPSRFYRTKLGQIQAVNDPLRPLINLSRGEQEQVLDDLSRRIELLLPSNFSEPLAASRTNVATDFPSKLAMEEAAKLIQQHARSLATRIEIVEKVPTTLFGTVSYRAKVTDGKGVIYCHANGECRGRTFYVQKGIGWFYETLIGGASSRLGLPVSDEEPADGTGYPTSFFEGGYIEWSPITDVARAVVRTPRGDQTLVEKRL